MTHQHHHCVCPHNNIRYCKLCQKPYCLDCGKEWGTHTYYPYYTYPYVYPHYEWTCTAGSGTGSGTVDSGSVTASCNHVS